MPLEKIPAILLVGLATTISLTAPTPPTPKTERHMEDAMEINSVLRILKASNYAAIQMSHQMTSIEVGYWAHAVTELCIVVGGTWSTGVVALLLPNGKHPDCIKLTPTTAFAAILVVLGTSLRYWCFREMGRHFTFHVTLLKNHKLVSTGPYSIVRHPSYTGFILMIVGNVVWYTSRGSWLRESIIYQMRWLLVVFVMFSLATTFLMVVTTFSVVRHRMPVEDAILKREFGKEWDEWAKRVPYQLFPGIL